MGIHIRYRQVTNQHKVYTMNPTFSDVVRQLLIASDYDSQTFSDRFGTGFSAYSDFTRGAHKRPNADLLQRVYEDLTGEDLIPVNVRVAYINVKQRNDAASAAKALRKFNRTKGSSPALKE